VLQGITRRTVFDLCAETGLAAIAADVTVSALKQADEVFITSTAGGIMPVTRVDGAAIGDGKVGPITRRLTKLYWDRHTDPSWSMPVRYP
jgi:branched-chain amino acid aminotransferase